MEQAWLEEILRKTNVATILRYEVSAEITQAVGKAVVQEREKVTKELSDWKEKFFELKDLLKRLQIDRHQRKAWLAMGDYHLLMEFIKAVEKKSGWKLPKEKGGLAT